MLASWVSMQRPAGLSQEDAGFIFRNLAVDTARQAVAVTRGPRGWAALAVSSLRAVRGLSSGLRGRVSSTQFRVGQPWAPRLTLLLFPADAQSLSTSWSGECPASSLGRPVPLPFLST